MNDEADRVLWALESAQSSQEKINLINRVSEFAHADAIAVLLRLLKDKDSAVRVAVCTAFEMIGTKSIFALVIALEDESSEVQTAAVSALYEISKREGRLIDANSANSMRSFMKSKIYLIISKNNHRLSNALERLLYRYENEKRD